MLIDEVKIRVNSGKGGKGAIAFDKNKMAIGPAGGSGGNGGSVYLEGIIDLGALRQFRHKKEHAAENGRDGRGQYLDGHVGEDLTLKVPVGTVVHNLDTDFKEEITKVGQRIMIAKGGRGGKGNFLFRAPHRTSPMIAQPGLPGESYNLMLELKMIADVGLIGLPNAGKSSLINELTAAKSKVANYPFTTLEPNLGVYYELILADIPGLIEGASAGKGLGTKFLRHIERTTVLFHLISAESTKPVTDYKVIRAELKKHNPKLIEKDEYVFLSKTDLTTPANVKKTMAILKKQNPKIIAISIHDWDSLEKVKKILNKIKEKKMGI